MSLICLKEPSNTVPVRMSLSDGLVVSYWVAVRQTFNRVSKTMLIGDYNEVGEEVGCYSHLTVQERIVGAVFSTRKNVKPVFVSPGYKIDLNTSIDLVLKSCRGYRLPEPARQAHNLVKKTATDKE